MIVNSKNLDAFRADYKVAMAELEKKYGVKMGVGTITYDGSSFRFKSTFVSKEGLLAEEAKAPKFTPEGSGVGSKVMIKNKVYTVVEYKERNWKSPYIIEGTNGKRYKISTDVFNRCLVK